jgi:anti-sigma factor RsiW
MSCKELELRMLEYLDGVLSPPEAARFEAHLAACPACAQEVARTRAVMAAVDGRLEAAPALDVESALARLRTRINDESAPIGATSDWWKNVRWWLAGGVAAAAAAGLLAVALTGLGPDEPTSVPEVATPEKALPPAAAEAAAMLDLVEALPLYEHLDCFENYEQIAALVEEDPAVLEQILAEVQG